jgi:transcriptional regulator with XRE-family HTH domain
LRAERKKRAWSQERTAAAAGLHLRHYQKLEEGSVNATLHTLERLAEALGLDPYRLLTP